ncbi:MAG: bifunctional 5,10-methylenetetrahydrofolate dehydrogenase/5,10-methenyltetrahydrofolate cyclohydrolase [bacterium]|nr:bifunctional 5,10-methylenetetrahydrofolate dehydrogenase/5,10-methenyltetrahydrofolate cyclohydrolase [bacterium]
MKTIDGRALALRIREQVKKEIEELGIHPTLGVLLVGDDSASHIYVNLKEKACHEAGIQTDIRRLPANTSEDELVEIIQAWNQDEEINAILIQIPLPKNIDQDVVIAEMDPAKDVDGFHPENYDAMLRGEAVRFPPVHEAILRLIGETDIVMKTSRAVILGNSETFIAPLERLLKQTGAVVDAFGIQDCDREVVQNADIIISAVGRAGFVTRDLIKSGAVIIDVGTNRLPDDRVVGDVDADNIKDIPGWISPVPGGVGPVTVALLLKNTLELAKKV